MDDDEDTMPECPRARVRTVPIPHVPLARMAEEWAEEQRDRPIVDLMLHTWLGPTGVPTTEVHRRLCKEALAWARALPISTPLSRARIAAITGGPSEALLHLIEQYTALGRG